MALLGPLGGEGKAKASDCPVPVCRPAEPHIFEGPGDVGPVVDFLAVHHHIPSLEGDHPILSQINIHLSSGSLFYSEGTIQVVRICY